MVIGQSKTENEPFIFDASTINCVEENCVEENDSNLECLFEDNWLMQVKENSWGGVQQQKRQRTSCDFPGGMIFFVLFCPLFEDILLTKSGKNNKKEHKRSKNTKIMIFFVLF